MSFNNIFENLQSPFPSAPMAGPAGEAPPPYSTLPAGAVEASGAVGGAAVGGGWSYPPSVGYIPAGMKLSYMDFVPQLVKKRLIGKNEYDTFR